MDCEKNTISPEHTVYAPGHKYMINHVFVYAKTPRRGEACKKVKYYQIKIITNYFPKTKLPPPNPPSPNFISPTNITPTTPTIISSCIQF